MTKQVLIGSMINNYEILDRIGHGGMGDVFLARHPQIGKKVAIKLLRPEYAKNPEATRRFFHEARVVCEINHPNVVDVLDFGETPSGDCYAIMEYLEGESLTSYIKEKGPLPLEIVGHIALQICAVLAAAHRKNIVHRDLKSDNIFLIERDATDNFVKLFDFGIAKLLDDDGPLLTLDGMTMGTPTYMSPEQALGRKIDGRTDIYALGVLMYLMTTRTYPFFDTNPIIVANMQVAEPLPPPSSRFPGVDSRLEAVIVRCLEKEPAQRYATMQDVAAALGPACGLDMAIYFGKRRPLLSQAIPVASPPLVNIEKRPSSLMLSSEVLDVPPAKRHSPWLAAALLVGIMGAGLVASVGGWPSGLMWVRPTLFVPSWSEEHFEAQPATLPTFLPEIAPAIPQASAPTTEAKKRIGFFKNLSWGSFQNSTTTKKKTPPLKP